MNQESALPEPPAAPATLLDHIRAAHAELQKAEQEERRSAADARRCRHVAQRRRIAIGRLLLKERSRWPERGPNAKGWGDFLRQVEIKEQSAREWCDLVEAIDISKPDDGGLEMTREEAREILKPAKHDLDAEPHAEPAAGADDEDVDAALEVQRREASMHKACCSLSGKRVPRGSEVLDLHRLVKLIWEAVRNYYATAESRELVDEDVRIATLLTDPEITLSDFKHEDRKAVAAVFKQVVDALGSDEGTS